jgi:tRNA (guanine37-N1)-methyltransferase
MASSTDDAGTGPHEVEAGRAAPRVAVVVVSLFPELFQEFVETSFVGRGIRAGLVQLDFVQLRDFGHGKHRSVDDTPYGGGSGMVMRVDSVVAAIEAAEARLGGRAHRVLMTPTGRRLSAEVAREFSTRPRWVLVCGRYEGFDERVRHFIDDEISLGDFVLTGGEIPAMALVEAAIRFIPGVLGNEHSAEVESFSEALAGGLEYPHYTRPVEYRGLGVPDVLKGGDHKKIDAYRRAESERRTREQRPDLLESAQKVDKS